MPDRLTITHDLPEPGATGALAGTLARGLRAGDVVALAGPMGAGKTTLVRHLAAALRLDARAVASPTFLVIAEHDAPGPGVLGLVHVDAYRLGSPDELESLGWDRLERGGLGARVLIAEWPDRLGPALAELAGGPERLARVALEITGEGARRVVMDLPSSWADRPAIARLAQREPIRCRSEGTWVAPDALSWPFATERAQQADLYRWFAGDYRISREIEQADLEQDE